MEHTLQAEQPVEALLRGVGLRATPQRMAVARAVMRLQHPTAGEVFEAVRAEAPTTSLGTVYAALESMTAHGLVRALPFRDAVRYDANVAPHVNLVCTACGYIEDFAGASDLLALLGQRTAVAAGFRLAQERVDLQGRCTACQAAESHSPRNA